MESEDSQQLTPLTTASANAPIGTDAAPVYPPNPATPEYTRAHAALSSQSAPYSANTGRILALESAVSKISNQVGDNEVSLKQVLEGQNFVAQLLMRFLNSDAEPGNTSLSVPLSLCNVHEHATVPQRPPLHSRPLSPQRPSPCEVQRDPEAVAVAGEECMASSRSPHIPTPPGHRVSAKLVAPDSLAMPTPCAAPVAAAPDAPANASSPPSWMSGSTVLITPSMDIQRPERQRPISPSAMSTDISDSIRTPSVAEDPLQPFLDIYDGPDRSWRASRATQQAQGSPSGCSPATPPTFTEAPRVHTRQQSNTDPDEEGRNRRGSERIRHGLMMMPRLSEDPVACNKPCYILHPDFPDVVVAEGKTGGSWKAKTQKLGHLCSKGEQMVQIHHIRKPDYRLLHIEERQPFTILDHVVVKRSGSNVFIKWHTRYLVRIKEQ
ncbi:hypothetical protein KC19_VG304400 [Ceratodon purpureus]|uniref:Uncharacterized protein n=1 Tax=Ceratodon purpureus TaxID=3225 RepID=A0A8T0HWW5_CERPU|nr:hypothetical protein KC19_VG304400 [Ceratodon purpureus]